MYICIMSQSIENLHQFVLNNFDKFSMKTKYGGAMAVTATPLVIFGSIYLAWAYVGRAWLGHPKSRVPKHVLTRSMSMALIHGGELALKRLINFQSYRVDTTKLKDAEIEFENLLFKENLDFVSIQNTMTKLEMSGKEVEAIKTLKKALEAAKTKPHEAYEIGMVLVEMMIYKGDYAEALRNKCLEEKEITDARIPLFKAIIHLLQGDPVKEARKYFNEFKEIQNCFQWVPVSENEEIYKIISNFEEFVKVVNLLKEDIEAAKNMSSTY